MMKIQIYSRCNTIYLKFKYIGWILMVSVKVLIQTFNQHTNHMEHQHQWLVDRNGNKNNLICYLIYLDIWIGCVRNYFFLLKYVSLIANRSEEKGYVIILKYLFEYDPWFQWAWLMSLPSPSIQAVYFFFFDCFICLSIHTLINIQYPLFYINLQTVEQKPQCWTFHNKFWMMKYY